MEPDIDQGKGGGSTVAAPPRKGRKPKLEAADMLAVHAANIDKGTEGAPKRRGKGQGTTAAAKKRATSTDKAEAGSKKANTGALGKYFNESAPICPGGDEARIDSRE